MALLRHLSRTWFVAPVILLVVLLQFGCDPDSVPNIYISPIVIVTVTPTATWLPTPQLQPEKIMFVMSTSTAQVKPRITNTATPTVTPSATLIPIATDTPIVTSTLYVTAVLSVTLSPTPTLITIATDTPAATATVTPAHTDTPTVTTTPSPSPTASPSPTPTPLPTPLGQGFMTQVPILMYHYLSAPPIGADPIRKDLSVSPEQFAQHLAYLQEEGYQTISLKQLSYALSRQEELPAKPIIITFDDGYRDHYENAFPILKEYGFSATFFVFTQVIDTYNVDFLTWEMVMEMHQAGMEFGSHSYRHPDLSNRDTDFLVYEILGSKEAIEERIKEPVRFFSYPAGQYDALTIRVLQSADFWGALTTQWGGQQSFAARFEMPRVRVRGSDGPTILAEKLRLVEP